MMYQLSKIKNKLFKVKLGATVMAVIDVIGLIVGFAVMDGLIIILSIVALIANIVVVALSD